jgi:hypothetical protein
MEPNMKKFLVTYLAPASVVDEWKKTAPEKRKQDEEKMQGEWKSWMRDHASNRGVRLMGDLPIFVSLDSCDAWAHRELFLLDENCGPPARLDSTNTMPTDISPVIVQQAASPKKASRSSRIRSSGSFKNACRSRSLRVSRWASRERW